MGQAQPLAGWCWVFSVVRAQMGPCSYIELRVWRCRTNRRTHHSDMPRTSGTHRNTWTDGFGCRHTMLAEYHHCQHLKMWIPPKRRKRWLETIIHMPFLLHYWSRWDKDHFQEGTFCKSQAAICPLYEILPSICHCIPFK